MAAVRCPKCAAVNHEGTRPYPRCRRCGEHLLKCRYCAHYDLRMHDCSHPLLRDGERVSDSDLYADCPQYMTTLRLSAGGRIIAHFTSPPVLTALVLAVLIAVGGYTFAHYYRPSEEVAAPRLTIRALARPVQARVGQTVWIKVDIDNRGRVPADHVTLYVDRAFVTRFEPVELLPAPEASRFDEQWEQLDFGPLGPGAGLTVRYTFIARTPGLSPLRLRLLSDQGMGHGAADLDVFIRE